MLLAQLGPKAGFAHGQLHVYPGSVSSFVHATYEPLHHLRFTRVCKAAQNPRDGAAPNVRSNPAAVTIRQHFGQVLPQRVARKRSAGERAIA